MEHNNTEARNGVDFCWCGCKYWRNSHCIDCGARYVHTGFETGAL